MPKRLWVGTTGHLWARILTRHVRKQGGHVTRFDHGSGCGYFSDSYMQGSHEFEDCDEFITFSMNQAEGMRSAYQANDIVQSNPPNITGFNSKNDCEPNKTFIRPDPIKKMMYIASIYPNGYFYPAVKATMRNHVMLDWEVRLMAKLKEWGYDVLFKPHPTDGICLAPPKSIEDLLGPIRLDKIFEEVYDQADLIILDDPCTSLLSTLLKSDKPVVYVDFEVNKFSDKSMSLLEKRFSIVKGSYNDQNRAFVDWEALRDAIEKAPDCMDKSFYHYYF